MLVNSVLFFSMNIYYIWNVIDTLEVRYEVFGKILALLLVLDSQLCFCWVYSMILNGLLQADQCISVLNKHLNLRKKMENQLGKPNNRKHYRLINGCLVFNFIYNFLISWVYQVIMFYEEMQLPEMIITVTFVIVATVSFNYLIKFNAFLIVLRSDLEFVGESTKLALLRNCDIIVQAEAYFELLSIMTLVMQVYSLPILFCIILVFYEGTVQWFEIYFIISNSHGKEGYVMEVITYGIWLWPMILMLLITMIIAGSTNNKVSCSNENVKII